jgi:hypothetical protein
MSQKVLQEYAIEEEKEVDKFMQNALKSGQEA